MNNCNICQKSFPIDQLLQSNKNEYFCKECFKYQYCKVVKKKKHYNGAKCEGDSIITSKKFFSCAELMAIKSGSVLQRGTISASKRPLQCPHVDCNRYISIFDVMMHFEHEHKDVTIIKNQDNHVVQFSSKEIRYGINQCLFLMNIAPSTDELRNKRNPSVCSLMHRTRIPITLAVLASRLAASQLSDVNESLLDDDDIADAGGMPDDKIIIWMSSNVVCEWNYTVVISTPGEHMRIKYYGPILQLGYKPKELCTAGHCLIINRYHILGLTKQGTKPLQLDVLIHP